MTVLGLTLGSAAHAVARDEAPPPRLHVDGAEVQPDENGRIRVHVQAGQAHIQVRLNGELLKRGKPADAAAAVTPALSVKQAEPGGAAVFTLALPADARGVFEGAPDVRVFAGDVTAPAPAPPGRTLTFTWDVAGARAEAPALAGTDLWVFWHYKPPGARRPVTCRTVAYLTMGKDGSVTIGEVSHRAADPHNAGAARAGAPRPAGRHGAVRGGKNVAVTIRRDRRGTTIGVVLMGTHQFTRQPEVKVTAGTLAERKWVADGPHGTEVVVWQPPEKVGEDGVKGTMTWSWVSRAADGEERTGALTAAVTFLAQGGLSIHKLHTETKITKPAPKQTPPDAPDARK